MENISVSQLEEIIEKVKQEKKLNPNLSDNLLIHEIESYRASPKTGKYLRIYIKNNDPDKSGEFVHVI